MTTSRSVKPHSTRTVSLWLLPLLFVLAALSGCATTSPAYHRFVMQG